MSEPTERSEGWAPLLWVALLAFFILLSYGLCRSAIDSLLQNDHGKDAYKYAYGAVALSVTLVVWIYARAAARNPIGLLIGSSAAVSSIVLALLLGARSLDLPYAGYGLYIWKDVYVVVLVELAWTLANAAFKQTTATWAYGFFCAAGTFGDMSGSYVAQALAHRMGSAQLLWLAIPVLAVVAFVGAMAARACGWPQPKNTSALQGVLKVVKASRNIQLMLALVVTIQIVTTLIDYQYRAIAYEAYPILDDRTAIFARIDIVISMSSLALQLFSGVFVALLGIRLLVILLPLLVAGMGLRYAIHPVFASMAALKVINKALDYSLFRTSKEMLYRPLTYVEQTQGKAAVDVFGYRVAKGGASSFLIIIPSGGALLILATLTGIGLWLVFGLLLVSRLTSNGSAKAVA